MHPILATGASGLEDGSAPLGQLNNNNFLSHGENSIPSSWHAPHGDLTGSASAFSSTAIMLQLLAFGRGARANPQNSWHWCEHCSYLLPEETHVSITHIPGVQNTVADRLSRLSIQEFRQLAPQADTMPTPILTPAPETTP